MGRRKEVAASLEQRIKGGGAEGGVEELDGVDDRERAGGAG